MPKEPEVVYRFHVTAEVAVDEIGPLLAQLTLMGVQKVTHELITDVVTFKNGRHYNGGNEVARAWIADHPTFRLRDIAEHFVSVGRSAPGANNAVQRLVQDGTLINLGNGHYQRSDVKAIAGPPESAPPKSGRGHTPQYSVGNKELLWQFVGRRKSFQISELTAHFKASGRPGNSATSIISKLCQEKFFKQLGDGEYEVLKRPENEARRNAAKAAKLNGASDHV